MRRPAWGFDRLRTAWGAPRMRGAMIALAAVCLITVGAWWLGSGVRRGIRLTDALLRDTRFVDLAREVGPQVVRLDAYVQVQAHGRGPAGGEAAVLDTVGRVDEMMTRADALALALPPGEWAGFREAQERWVASRPLALQVANASAAGITEAGLRQAGRLSEQLAAMRAALEEASAGVRRDFSRQADALAAWQRHVTRGIRWAVAVGMLFTVGGLLRMTGPAARWGLSRRPGARPLRAWSTSSSKGRGGARMLVRARQLIIRARAGWSRRPRAVEDDQAMPLERIDDQV